MESSADFILNSFRLYGFLYLNVRATLREGDVQCFTDPDLPTVGHDATLRIAHQTVAARKYPVRIEQMEVLLKRQQSVLVTFKLARKGSLRALRVCIQQIARRRHIRRETAQALHQ